MSSFVLLPRTRANPAKLFLPSFGLRLCPCGTQPIVLSIFHRPWLFPSLADSSSPSSVCCRTLLYSLYNGHTPRSLLPFSVNALYSTPSTNMPPTTSSLAVPETTYLTIRSSSSCVFPAYFCTFPLWSRKIIHLAEFHHTPSYCASCARRVLFVAVILLTFSF